MLIIAFFCSLPILRPAPKKVIKVRAMLHPPVDALVLSRPTPPTVAASPAKGCPPAGLHGVSAVGVEQPTMTVVLLIATPADVLVTHSMPPLVERARTVPIGETTPMVRVASVAQPTVTPPSGAEASGGGGAILMEAHL